MKILLFFMVIFYNFAVENVIKYLFVMTDINFKGYVDDAVELLKALISTPSVSRDESRAADVMQRYMTGWGLEPRRVNNNLIIEPERFDENKPTLLLNAHIDTVKPAATWTRDPFTPTMEGDVLYGLGSNDCGGGLVSLLQVLRILRSGEAGEVPYNLVYMASAEEEVSGENGVRLALSSLPHIDVVLIGEPTGMQPAVAEKGLLVVDVISHGKSGHAARNEGINAIYLMLPDLQWIKDYKFQKVSDLLGPVKMTATVIHAGVQHNVIPDTCEVMVDIRFNELYSNKEIFEIMQKNLKNEVRAHSFRLNSSRIDPSHPLVRNCVALGMTPYGSPTLSDQALMPFESLKIGPGDSARSHTADEFIKISEIEDAIKKYIQIITNVPERRKA